MRLPRPASVRSACLLAFSISFAASSATALERKLLRVGTSGDYAPWSERAPAPEGEREIDGNSLNSGFDIEVARAYATERDLELRFVPFRWPKLLELLAADRFDVAMSGITVRSERSLAGRFSVPVAEAGAILLLPPESSLRSVEDLERLTRVRIAVNAGGHLEQVAQQRFPNATLVAVSSNPAVLEVLLARGAEVALTDTSEAPIWLARAQAEKGEKLRLIGPLTQDRKAYLFPPGADELAADFDAWLAAREASGWLAELRAERLRSEEARPLAAALPALFAAIDERLSLMPMLGVAKRREGFPIEVPEREVEVLNAAVMQVRDASLRAGRAEPSEAEKHALRELYRAQFDAAKQIQLAAVRDELIPDEVALPDVEEVLRPALDRIGERIARLIVALPVDAGQELVESTARLELRTDLLGAPARDLLTQAVVVLVLNQRDSARAASPASTGTAAQTP